MAKAKRQRAVIFRATVRLRNGRILRARDYGLSGFPIRIRGR